MYHVIECLKRLYKSLKIQNKWFEIVLKYSWIREDKSLGINELFFLFCNYCCVDGGTLVSVININLVHYVWLFIHGIMITSSWTVALKLYMCQLGQRSHFKWRFSLQYWLLYWQLDVFLKLLAHTTFLMSVHFCLLVRWNDNNRLFLATRTFYLMW